MTAPLFIMLFVLAGTLLAFRKKPSKLLALILAIELVATIFSLIRQFQGNDVSKPYELVFRGGGYGLGRLLVESGRPTGKVLLIQTGEGKVNQWQVEGFETALKGSGFSVADTKILPVDPYSGRFEADRFDETIKNQSSIPYVAAFAGLPVKSSAGTDQLYVCFHSKGVDDMQPWLQSGRLLGVIAPRMGDAPKATGREKLTEIPGLFFNIRRSSGVPAK